MFEQKSKRNLKILVITLITGILFILLSDACIAQTAGKKSLKVALLPIPDVLPFHVAQELGYFKAAGLDVAAAAAVREDLASLVDQERVTVLLTTHNMAEAEKLCSQVAVIRQGKLVAQGHPDKLRAQAGSPRVEVLGRGFSDQTLDLVRSRPEVADARAHNGRLAIDLRWEADPAPLIRLLVNSGIDVQEVQRGKASLEEVFLTLMNEESRPAEAA